MQRILLLLTLICFAGQASATLTTPSYLVDVETHCEEGVVVCDKVTYRGTSKKTGESIQLIGKTLHTTCADGVSPCRFLGWRFEHGDTTYTVLEEGVLIVERGNKVLLEEKGNWNDQ
jgi:hypothetical protein